MSETISKRDGEVVGSLIYLAHLEHFLIYAQVFMEPHNAKKICLGYTKMYGFHANS